MNVVRRAVLFAAVSAAISVLAAGAQPGAPEPQHVAFFAFPRDVVIAHNSVRSRIGLPPLDWSEELARVAQNWADTLLARGEFAHRPNNRFGENLYEITGGSSTPYNVVNAWAAEAANYEYTTNRCYGLCGHYTQIIWRDTKQVGCGVARDARREIWVCNYAPFGNIIGEKPY